MDKDVKIAKSSQLREELDGVAAVVLVAFEGLTVADANDLRGEFREAGCTYRVFKNSVIRWAITDTPHEPLTPLLKGMTGLAYNTEDPGAPARVARDFGRTHSVVELKGGVMEGERLDAAGVARLADLPGPMELKSQLLRLFNTPATQCVRVLNASVQSLLNVLVAKKDKDAA